MNRFNDEIKVEVESDKSAGGGGIWSLFSLRVVCFIKWTFKCYQNNAALSDRTTSK